MGCSRDGGEHVHCAVSCWTAGKESFFPRLPAAHVTSEATLVFDPADPFAGYRVVREVAIIGGGVIGSASPSVPPDADVALP